MDKLSFETAIKLKEAGFLQPDAIGVGQGVFIDYPLGEKWIDGKSVRPYAPSLSELIDACGKDFCSLFKDEHLDNVFFAKAWDHRTFKSMDGAREAVAGLYLLLKNKI